VGRRELRRWDIAIRRSKSGEAYHVPMNDDVRAVLRDLPSRLRSAWVFPSETGETAIDAKNHMHRVLNAGSQEGRHHRLTLARPVPHLRVTARDGRR
jgi:hypothetical protein